MTKITVSDVTKKRLRVVAYLLSSSALGYVLATYVAKDMALTAIFTPVINFILVTIAEELKNEGFIRAIENER